MGKERKVVLDEDENPQRRQVVRGFCSLKRLIAGKGIDATNREGHLVFNI